MKLNCLTHPLLGWSFLSLSLLLPAALGQAPSEPVKPAAVTSVRVLVAFDSLTGNTEKMAQGVVEGAKRVTGVVVVLKPVDKVAKEDLQAADGIILGCPTYFGTMPGQMKVVIDDWSWKLKVDFTDKVGGAFATGGGQAGGKEFTVLSLVMFMLNNRMVVAGPLYRNEKTGSVWGEVGAAAMTGPLANSSRTRRREVPRGTVHARSSSALAHVAQVPLRGEQRIIRHELLDASASVAAPRKAFRLARARPRPKPAHRRVRPQLQRPIPETMAICEGQALGHLPQRARSRCRYQREAARPASAAADEGIDGACSCRQQITLRYRGQADSIGRARIFCQRGRIRQRRAIPRWSCVGRGATLSIDWRGPFQPAPGQRFLSPPTRLLPETSSGSSCRRRWTGTPV